MDAEGKIVYGVAMAAVVFAIMGVIMEAIFGLELLAVLFLKLSGAFIFLLVFLVYLIGMSTS